MANATPLVIKEVVLFVQAHDGRLPTDWNEFLSWYDNTQRPQSSGSYHGWQESDLRSRYRLAWNVNVRSIVLAEGGNKSLNTEVLSARHPVFFSLAGTQHEASRNIRIWARFDVIYNPYWTDDPPLPR